MKRLTSRQKDNATLGFLVLLLAAEILWIGYWSDVRAEKRARIERQNELARIESVRAFPATLAK